MYTPTPQRTLYSTLCSLSSQTKVLEKTLNSLESELDNLDKKLCIDIGEKEKKAEQDSNPIICWKNLQVYMAHIRFYIGEIQELQQKSIKLKSFIVPPIEAGKEPIAEAPQL